jgi:hypothetical protein
MNQRLTPLLALPVFALVSSASPAFAAGSIRASVAPNVLVADGISTAIVSAEVRNSGGRPVRDGTEVRFYTTAGSITSVAFTSAGTARATLTAANSPQTANVSVSAGLDQQVITVPMVSKVVEASVGGRVMRITGKYVAFAEDKRIIQSDGQVKIVFRGVEIEANSAQIDVEKNTIKALGRIHIASDDKTVVGERLWLDLKTFEGYLVSVEGKKWFSAYGLTDLPEKPKNLDPDFDLEDYSDSKLVWVAKQANYVIDDRVQVQGARAFVGGIKSIKMPFHQTNLRGGFGETEQFVGIGSQGLTVDIPFYLRMTPGSTTALNIGYGARDGGVGYFTRNKGLAVDLVQKYGFSGASEGQAMLTNLNSPQRVGMTWLHTQQINKTTRLVTNLQFPQHKDIYGQVNLTAGMPFGNLQAGFVGNKIAKTGQFGKTLSFAFETKPRPIADGLVALSAETKFYRRDPQEIRLDRGLTSPGGGGNRVLRYNVPGSQYQSFGIKARPRQMNLGHGFTLDSSVSLRQVMGNTTSKGFGPALETTFNKQLPNNGNLSFGLNYNGLASLEDYFPTSGRMNAVMSLSYPINKKFRITGLGTMGLDNSNRNSLIQLSYQINDKWRLDMLHSMFRFGEFGNFDMQFGISRMMGSRELGLYWSRREHKFIIEFGASRF